MREAALLMTAFAILAVGLAALCTSVAVVKLRLDFRNLNDRVERLEFHK